MTCRFTAFISANNPSKSDKKDVFILALFALSNPQLLSSSHIPSEAKLIARHIEKLNREIAEAKTQIKQTLTVLFPEAEKHFNVFSKSFLPIITLYPSAPAIAKADKRKIAQIFSRESNLGRKPSISPSKLIFLAQNSIGISHPGFEEILRFYVDKLLFLMHRVTKLEDSLKEMIEFYNKKHLNLISSIKGISKNLAARFLAEVENVERFPNAKKLIKYAGTDSVIKQSGKWKMEMSISKQGNPHLRSVLFQMAVSVVRWENTFRAYFEKKYQQFRSYKKAMIAVVNKLVRVIYALCSKNEPFNPHRVSRTSEFSHVSKTSIPDS